MALPFRLDVAADRRGVEAAAAIRNPVAVAFDDDAGDRTNAGRLVDGGHLGLAEATLGIDVQPHCDPPPFEGEYRLAVFHARGTDAARTEDASVMIKIDIGVGRVDLPSGPLIGLSRRHHTETVAERLQLAIPARHAVGAGMIALDIQHFDDGAPVVGQLPGVVLDYHAMGGRRHAGRAVAAIDLAGADTAIPGRLEVRMMAKARNIDPGRVARLDDRLSFGCPAHLKPQPHLLRARGLGPRPLHARRPAT